MKLLDSIHYSTKVIFPDGLFHLGQGGFKILVLRRHSRQDGFRCSHQITDEAQFPFELRGIDTSSGVVPRRVAEATVKHPRWRTAGAACTEGRARREPPPSISTGGAVSDQVVQQRVNQLLSEMFSQKKKWDS